MCFDKNLGTILEIEVLHDLNHKKVQVFYSSKQSTRCFVKRKKGNQPTKPPKKQWKVTYSIYAGDGLTI